MPKNSSDLSPEQQKKYIKYASAAAALINFDVAVTGPGVIGDPQFRVMTGAVNAAHATEQITLVTAGGGIQNNHLMSESGKVVK